MNKSYFTYPENTLRTTSRKSLEGGCGLRFAKSYYGTPEGDGTGEIFLPMNFGCLKNGGGKGYGFHHKFMAMHRYPENRVLVRNY